ncbi:hypothetical protein AB0D08_16705 [Kitasatospora sp. NPDC048540]|uniref:hypothetical protein n=1 Tax=unclassified Kitasatospora TaxID=2633591 RepID=UPI00053A80B8|nr:hypothetical protein [Kitasatospora sp. MBT63]
MPSFTITDRGGVSFPPGDHTAVAFFCDNTLDGSPQAALRVVVWSPGHPDVHRVAVGNDGGRQVVVPFADPAATHTVTVTRTDGLSFPVYAAVT